MKNKVINYEMKWSPLFSTDLMPLKNEEQSDQLCEEVTPTLFSTDLMRSTVKSVICWPVF